MRLSLEIGSLRVGFSLDTSTPEPSSPAVPSPAGEEHQCPSHEEEWDSYRANRAATGGQFGFGRTDSTAIETPESRWETRRVGRRTIK